jgi:hypothetical protein
MAYAVIPGIGFCELGSAAALLPGAALLSAIAEHATGSLDATESGDDSASITGRVIVSGALAAFESATADTAAFSGVSFTTPRERTLLVAFDDRSIPVSVEMRYLAVGRNTARSIGGYGSATGLNIYSLNVDGTPIHIDARPIYIAP